MKLEEKISRTLLQLRYQDPFATLTKKEVAEEAGFSTKYYSKLENGEAMPTLRILESIAKVYNRKLSDLVKLIEEQG